MQNALYLVRLRHDDGRRQGKMVNDTYALFRGHSQQLQNSRQVETLHSPHTQSKFQTIMMDNDRITTNNNKSAPTTQRRYPMKCNKIEQ